MFLRTRLELLVYLQLRNTGSKLYSYFIVSDDTFIIYHIIIGILIYVQVQGHHPHQWAPFQVTG